MHQRMELAELLNRCDTAIRNGEPIRSLDWDKVARMIKDHGTECVIYAGIMEDWMNTVDMIYDRGEVIIDHRAHTSSVWGTPTIEVYVEDKGYKICGLDGFVMYGEEPSDTWTPSALSIL